MPHSDRFRDVLSTALLTILLAAGPAFSPRADTSDRPYYSPYAHRDFPDQLHWGDTHVHTALSHDAWLDGAYNLGPEQAYRIARGETITGNRGEPVALARPLDFMAVTDHAELLGVIRAVWREDQRLMSQPDGERWLQLVREARRHAGDNFARYLVAASRTPEGTARLATSEVELDAWRESMQTAERFNEPGRFTAFIGYEWTGMVDGNNLHRVVLFRDGMQRVSGVGRPFSMGDSANPEDLWDFMQRYEARSGGRVLAIPHNGNLSNGMMFGGKDSCGAPRSATYATNRARWEPLYEVTQTKGDAESHPALSPDDPFADYENWDFGNLRGGPKQPWMLACEYARAALQLGLRHQRAVGVNPFRLGLIGSSDSHTGMPAVREENMMGKSGVDEPSAGRAEGMMTLGALEIPKSRYTASGYAGVWARENTREALFDAMQRREVYATTGSRIRLRFFAGWDFDDIDALRPDLAAIGYGKGVPMGAELPRAPAGESPTLLVFAGKDPMGANLERIQVIKGWLDADGVSREKVYDLALSDNRQPATDGGIAPRIRSTVDVRTATYTNTVGAPQLATVWRDPDFDPDLPAFYYLRVLEIPTPRWTTFDSAFYGSELPDTVPAELQERAYSSPVWYRP